MKQGAGLRPHHLPSRSADFLDADEIGHPRPLRPGALRSPLDHLRRHGAAEIDLDHDVIGVKIVVGAHHGVAPLGRAPATGPVG
jgi:hypothetical protein